MKWTSKALKIFFLKQKHGNLWKNEGDNGVKNNFFLSEPPIIIL